jgi:hypothetical protein
MTEIRDELMKRIATLLAFVLVFALAVPASAATWRTYANVRADQGKAAYAGGTAKDTTDIQLGIYSYGRNRYVEWQADFTCWKGTDYTSRSKSGTKWVPAGEWRYILVRDAASQSDECDISGYIYPPALDDFGSTRLVLRVR